LFNQFAHHDQRFHRNQDCCLHGHAGRLGRQHPPLSSSVSTTALKGSRNLQFGGIVIAIGQGASTTTGNVNIGLLGTAAGPHSSYWNRKRIRKWCTDAVGASNGFAPSQLGAATATGTGGGNSTAATLFTLLDLVDGTVAGTGFFSSAGAGNG